MRGFVGLASILVAGGCGASPWATSHPSPPAADVAAIQKLLNQVNDAFAISGVAGANAMASADYEVFAGVATKQQCVRVWREDPAFFEFLQDTLKPETVAATPNVVPPDMGAVPKGRIYVFEADETSSRIGESHSGETGARHHSIETFHATVMPDGAALMFVSCQSDPS